MKKILFLIAVISIGILFSVSTSMATFINPVSGDGSGNNLQNKLDALASTPPLLNASGVSNDALANDAYWAIQASGGAVSTFIIQITGYVPAGFERFGIFDAADPTKKVGVFGGVTANPGDQVTVAIHGDGGVFINAVDSGVDFNSNLFGFYLSTGGVGGLPTNTFYSKDSLNSDANDHMVAFQGNGKTIQLPVFWPGTFATDEYILAFEDLPWIGNSIDPTTGAINGLLSDRDYNDTVLLIESVERVPERVPEPATMLLLGLGLLGVAGIRRKFKG